MKIAAAKPLDVLRAQACARVDYAAESKRAWLRTPGEHQSTLYGLKVEEARAFKAEGNPGPGRCPLLAAEAAATGETLEVVAIRILDRAEAYKLALAGLEGARLIAKRSIGKAESEAAIEGHVARFQAAAEA